MSMEAMLATFELTKSQVTSSEKLLLLSLARRAGEDHTCWPSVARMVADTCMDRKTIIDVRQNLIRNGFIKILDEGKGRSGQILVMQLLYVDQWEKSRNSPRLRDEDSTENGTGKKLTSTENGIGTSTENGIGTSTENGTLNIKEEKIKRKEKKERENQASPPSSL